MYDNDGMDKPLFGEARPRDRWLSYGVGGFTSLLVAETLISSLIFPHWPPKGVHVFLACIIVMVCLAELLLIYWYKQGDVDPKFRQLIYYNAFTTVLLCICANVYYHQ